MPSNVQQLHWCKSGPYWFQHKASVAESARWEVLQVLTGDVASNLCERRLQTQLVMRRLCQTRSMQPSIITFLQCFVLRVRVRCIWNVKDASRQLLPQLVH
eukprot:gnl/TRDRNA2_/TRDRNA2_171515_c1_seq1.p1 gnl/TRDRNA2_/TRDRNA2_171515_c1~~gnl/TRDRNA2_/TRDRNA2_171515_c1_seq1.p1  ORF type:complete len:101 (-),score=6.65 gnl/TRDRNA2_/TRDRNA2_171515_c1_seq1:198-500(-)